MNKPKRISNAQPLSWAVKGSRLGQAPADDDNVALFDRANNSSFPRVKGQISGKMSHSTANTALSIPEVPAADPERLMLLFMDPMCRCDSSHAAENGGRRRRP